MTRRRPAAAPADERRDPWPYDGPLARLDGARPFNRHFWPSECWAYGDEHPAPYVHFWMRFEIVALADGRFSTDGWVPGIESGRDCYGRPCVFADRRAAIRASAARMIRLCRRIVRRRGSDVVGVSPESAPRIIAWARAVAARETGGAAPRAIAIRVPPPPAPAPQKTGLPLFDAVAAR